MRVRCVPTTRGDPSEIPPPRKIRNFHLPIREHDMQANDRPGHDRPGHDTLGHDSSPRKRPFFPLF